LITPGGASFGGAGMAAHRVHLGNQGDAQLRGCFGKGNGSAQTCSAGAYDCDIGR
jgi:hypothetical protein